MLDGAHTITMEMMGAEWSTHNHHGDGAEWSTHNHHGDGGRVEHTQSPWRWGWSGAHTITMEMGQSGAHTITMEMGAEWSTHNSHGDGADWLDAYDFNTVEFQICTHANKC
ncbi:hypothetical protein LEMLEM_LOCUS12493 [Lemmus lemmus]